ncbi:bifunctional ADP-dependent NAD(P)H-hydrate dehydratase/NAD(P)H-hydrate epimerase [Corynebacterium resistens]
MFPLFSAEQIRSAEETLLDQQTSPDELMRLAAGHVAQIAREMLPAPGSEALQGIWDEGTLRAIVLLVGSGGNGGDSLYAGAELLKMGYRVQAYAVATGRRVKESAKKAYDSAGGQWVEELPIGPEAALVIDGIAGLGSARALPEDVAEFLADARSFRVPVLAIDVPSGVNADTGETPADVTVKARGFEPDDSLWAIQRVPAHVKAATTITFGGLRHAHALSPWCGKVVLVDLELPTEEQTAPLKLSDELWKISADIPRYFEPIANIEVRGQQGSSGVPISTGLPFAAEPGPLDHKYTGGVVGICAGSEAYPGAGIFAAVAATRATSAAVRLFSPPHQVVHFTPEALLTATSLTDSLPPTPTTSSPHALVIGPGRGTGNAQARELQAALGSTLPLVLDADALTLLAEREELMQTVRSRKAFTLLTPHAGEFARIAPADIPDPGSDPMRATRALAKTLNCSVLLKGRSSVLASPSTVAIVNAGSSWAATPGSGDVLAGVLGAYVARATKAIKDTEEYFPALAEAKRTDRTPRGSVAQDPSELDAHIFAEHILAGLHVHAVATKHAASVTYPTFNGENLGIASAQSTGAPKDGAHTGSQARFPAEPRSGEAPATALGIAYAVSSATAALTHSTN